MPEVIGDFNTTDIDDDVILFDVDEDLHELQTDMAPITVLTQRSTPDSDLESENPEYKWWEQDMTSPSLTSNGSHTDTATTITLATDEADRLHEQDLVYVTTTDEVMRVTAVDRTADEITVTRAVGGSTATAISDGDEMIVFGPAEAEGADVPEKIIPSREKHNNYTQIFRHAFGVSNTTASTVLFGAGDPEFDRQSNLKEKEHIRAKEFAYMFGRKAEISSGGDIRRTTGGAIEFIGQNVLDAGGTMTEDDLNTIAQDVFQYGSSEKWCLAGGNIIDAVNGFIDSSGDTEQVVNLSPDDEEAGIRVTRYKTNYGPINFVYHRLLSRYGRNDLGFIFDRESLNRKVIDTERDELLRMNVQPRGADRMDSEYLSEVGFKLMNEEKCGMITNA